MLIHSTKNLCLAICHYRPCLTHNELHTKEWKEEEKDNLYILNIKYHYLNPVFRILNNPNWIAKKQNNQYFNLTS